jgi:hypothetical protein
MPYRNAINNNSLAALIGRNGRGTGCEQKMDTVWASLSNILHARTNPHAVSSLDDEQKEVTSEDTPKEADAFLAALLPLRK